MRAQLAFVATLAVVALLGSAAGAAPALDSNGKCRDGGKFVSANLCKAKPAAAAGKCRDIKTKKFAQCGAPGAEAVPKT